jgi:hypothetical protein
MSLNAMKLTSRDMARARVMLKEQSEGEDPYDLLDNDDDPSNRDKRRVLIIWCLWSRKDSAFTWDQAWELPFDEVYADDDEDGLPDQAEEGDAPLTLGPASGPSPNGNAASRKKRAAAAPAPR